MVRLGFTPDGLQGASGFEHGHDPGTVVGGAGAQVPAIDVAADQDDLVGFLRPGSSATVL